MSCFFLGGVAYIPQFSVMTFDSKLKELNAMPGSRIRISHMQASTLPLVLSGFFLAIFIKLDVSSNFFKKGNSHTSLFKLKSLSTVKLIPLILPNGDI